MTIRWSDDGHVELMLRKLCHRVICTLWKPSIKLHMTEIIGWCTLQDMRTFRANVAAWDWYLYRLLEWHFHFFSQCHQQDATGSQAGSQKQLLSPSEIALRSIRKKTSKNLEKQNTLREDNADVTYDLIQLINFIIRRWNRQIFWIDNFLPVIDQFISSRFGFLHKLGARVGRSQRKLWWRFAAILTCKSIVKLGYRGERLIDPLAFITRHTDSSIKSRCGL